MPYEVKILSQMHKCLVLVIEKKEDAQCQLSTSYDDANTARNTKLVFTALIIENICRMGKS